MKVLHIEGGRHLYGGAQQVLYLLEGLKDHGVVSLLACPKGCELARAANGLAEIHELPMRGDLDLSLVAKIARLIAACRPDVVHLHSRIGADVMGGIAARWRRVPVVHSRRVDNPEPRWLVAVKYRLFDRVIAISDGIARVMLAEGLPERKLRVVSSAVPIAVGTDCGDRRHIADRLGISPAGPWLGVVAQLIPRKGHRYLIAALPALLADFPQLQVIFFGQGPLASELRRQAAALDLAGRVHLAGFRNDLSDCLPCLDILVHPATMEGLGVALLQAASAGVAIVATRVGGIPEVVEDDRTGLLVPAADAAALEAACHRLLADQALRRRLGSAARERVCEHFSLPAMVAGNLAVYRELVAQREDVPAVT